MASWGIADTCGALKPIDGRPGNKGGNNCFIVVWKCVNDATGWTCSTAGITEQFGCKGLRGWNTYAIDTNASSTFYSNGHDFVIAQHGGLRDGVCVNYNYLASFSIKNRAGLTPTTVGRSLDVSTGGEAGLDWANIGSPQTVQSLGCTSIFSVQSTCNTVQVGGYASGQTPLQPTVAGRTLDVSTGGEAGLDWANIGSPQTVQVLGCTRIFSTHSTCNTVDIGTCATIFSVQKVIDRPFTDPCSTIFSVQKVVDRPFTDPCSTIFSVRSVLNSVLVDPCAAVFSTKSVLNTVSIDSCSTIFSVQKVIDRP